MGSLTVYSSSPVTNPSPLFPTPPPTHTFNCPPSQLPAPPFCPPLPHTAPGRAPGPTSSAAGLAAPAVASRWGAWRRGAAGWSPALAPRWVRPGSRRPCPHRCHGGPWRCPQSCSTPDECGAMTGLGWDCQYQGRLQGQEAPGQPFGHFTWQPPHSVCCPRLMNGLWLMRIHKAGTAEALRSPGPAAHLCGGFIRLVQVSVRRMVVGALGLGCLPVTMGQVSQRTAGTCKYG